MHEEINRARSLGLAVALGAALGAAGGAVTGHMGVWVAVGIAAYIVITVAGTWKPKTNGNDERPTTDTTRCFLWPLERVSTLVRANLNDLIDKGRGPER